MSGSQPIPPSKRRQAHLLKTQNRFWDVINSIELPIIIFMQKHFGAYSSTKFWNFIAKIASPSNIRFLPMILYSLGFEKSSKHLALSLVYFALFSSFGKYLIVRRRPGSYEGVHSPACASTSSFPSRHTISITIVAFFLPFTQLWITLIILSRIMLGMHFLTDCILGVLFGKLALCLASLIDDPNFSLFMLLLTFRVWSGAYKILSGALPILIVESSSSSSNCYSFVYSPLCIFLVFVWKFVRKFFPPAKIKILKDKKESKKSDPNYAQKDTNVSKKSESKLDSVVKNDSTNDDLIHVDIKESKKKDSIDNKESEKNDSDNDNTNDSQKSESNIDSVVKNDSTNDDLIKVDIKDSQKSDSIDNKESEKNDSDNDNTNDSQKSESNIDSVVTNDSTNDDLIHVDIKDSQKSDSIDGKESEKNDSDNDNTNDSQKSESNIDSVVTNDSTNDDLIKVDAKKSKKSDSIDNRKSEKNDSDYVPKYKKDSNKSDSVPVVKKDSKKSDTDSVYVVKKNTDSYEMLVIELIPISFVVFLISETNGLLFCIRQINFVDNLYIVDADCSLCTSRFNSFLLNNLLKIRFFTKVLLGIKYVDLFAIDLKDKIVSFF